MSCCHEFGVINLFSNNLKKFTKYNPEKYNCISIHDDFIISIADKFQGIEFINPCTNEKCYNLCYCGITIIPPKSHEAFIEVLKRENDCIYEQLILLFKKAMIENKYIIHYGI